MPDFASRLTRRPVARLTLLTLACSICFTSLCASTVFIRKARANENLQVDEAASRATLERTPLITLRILNSSGAPLNARIKLELLDTQNRTRASAARETTLDAGANDVAIRLPAPALRADEQDALPWFRLRYAVEPIASSSTALAAAAAGIVSLARIAPDIFDLQVTAHNTTREAARYNVRARTVNHATARPIAGVRVTAKIEFDHDDDEKSKRTPLIALATTDADGYALFAFDLPARAADSDDTGDVTVTAERNGFTQEASEEFRIYNIASILISTDKPIYQPGQPLRIRALALDARRRPLTRTPLTLKIEDGESTTLFRIDLETSRFGVAHTQWQIPENAKLGDYRINIEIADGAYAENSETIETVKVSRYELPNFAVKVAPEKPYYPPTDTSAKVEVTADYLFGQPLKGGRVRVVRETEREWNYREQRWDVKEAAEYAGDVDADGKFTAQINPADEHADLAESDYARFRDITFAAYFTDATTNRTEQRRFDLRITKNAIHTYVIPEGFGARRDAPMDFYITTFYADGTPAPAMSQSAKLYPPPRRPNASRQTTSRQTTWQRRPPSRHPFAFSCALFARIATASHTSATSRFRLRFQPPTTTSFCTSPPTTKAARAASTPRNSTRRRPNPSLDQDEQNDSPRRRCD